MSATPLAAAAASGSMGGATGNTTRVGPDAAAAAVAESAWAGRSVVLAEAGQVAGRELPHPQQQSERGQDVEGNDVQGSQPGAAAAAARPSSWPQHLIGGVVMGAGVCAATGLGAVPPWRGLGKGSCPLAFNLS